MADLPLLQQATLYQMAQRIIDENAGVQSVTYTLPNKHYIPVDMKYIGVDNLTPLSILLVLFFCSLGSPFFRRSLYSVSHSHVKTYLFLPLSY